MKSIRSLFAVAALCGIAISPAAAQTPDEIDAFWKACRSGDAAAVRKFLDSGLNPNQKFQGGVTPLLAATLRGQLEVVKVLVERGADPSVRDDSFKITPLGMALFFGQMPVVEYLLPRATSDLDLVLRLGAARGVAPLVEAGLRSNPTPQDLAIALVLVKSRQKADLVAMLEKAGAKAPPELTTEDLQRFVGTYEDRARMDVQIEIRDGKLIGTGGAGFGEFFEEELVPAGPNLVFLKINPIQSFQFEGSGKQFSRVTMASPGSSTTLERVGGERK